MRKSILNLNAMLTEATGGEHRIYRHTCSDRTFNALSETASKENYFTPKGDEELTLLECSAPKPWTFYNYFQLTSFLYTPSGVVTAGVVSLKKEAESIEVTIDVLDKRTQEVLATRKLGTKSKHSFRFEEIFSITEKEPEELLAMVTATWKQDDKTETLTAIRERCISKPFRQGSKLEPMTYDTANYTHIYPKKEISPVIFGNPQICDNPEDYKHYEPQKDIVVALLRLPEKRTDCDYICGFERGPKGYPNLAVPAKGIIDLREKKGEFIGVLSKHCILTRLDEAGGATLLTGGDNTRTFENPDITCTFNSGKNVLTYDGTRSWQQEFDYKSGFDKVYRFDYDLILDYEYKINGKKDLGRLHVSSDFSLCDLYIPVIRIMYGCLAKDTLILMADGSRIRIDSIQVGDLIQSGIAGHRVQRVVNIWQGMEKKLVRIRTHECTLSLTESHPVLTPAGVVRASKLQTGMEVCLEGGNTEKIIDIEEIDYTDLVYNLTLEDKSNPYLVAERFIVGDMNLQNTVL